MNTASLTRGAHCQGRGVLVHCKQTDSSAYKALGGNTQGGDGGEGVVYWCTMSKQ